MLGAGKFHTVATSSGENMAILWDDDSLVQLCDCQANFMVPSSSVARVNEDRLLVSSCSMREPSGFRKRFIFHVLRLL